MELVFVYGTLKKGQPNHHILDNPNCSFVSAASTFPNRWEMYNLGAYPTIVPAVGPHEKIRGEVYEVDKETLEHLDFLEGYPTLYDRALVLVVLAGIKKPSLAWVYCMPRAPIHSTQILDGVW